VVLLLGGNAAAATQPALFWGDLVGATIGRANLDGSVVDRNFITVALRPTGLAVPGAGQQLVESNEHNNAIRARVI
jgi:hypothetical protein